MLDVASSNCRSDSSAAIWARARRAAIWSAVSGVLEAVCAEAGEAKLTASAAMSDNAVSAVLLCVSNFIGSMHFVYADFPMASVQGDCESLWSASSRGRVWMEM